MPDGYDPEYAPKGTLPNGVPRQRRPTQRPRFSDDQVAALRAFGDATGWTLATVKPSVREAFCSQWAVSRSRLANFFSNHKPRGHCTPNPDALRDASDLSRLPGLVGADASPDAAPPDATPPTHPAAPASGRGGRDGGAGGGGAASTATAGGSSEGGGGGGDGGGAPLLPAKRPATPGDASPSPAGVPSPSLGDGGSARRRKLAPQVAAFE